jgi:hypothetical protein
MAETPKADGKDKSKKGGAIGWIGFIFGLAVAAAFFGATLLLVFIGMLPTLVAVITDNSRQKNSAIAIGVLNFAGVLPFVIGLLGDGGNLADAVKLLLDPTTLMVMYGAAGIGWAIFNYVPKSVATYTTLRAQSGIAARQNLQKQLIERWGQRVASDKPIGALEKEE